MTGRKLFLAGVCLILAATAAFAGGRPEPADENDVTVVVKKFGSTAPLDSTENEVVWQAIQAAFEDSTGILLNFDMEVWPWQDAYPKINTAWAANQPYDVSSMARGWISPALSPDGFGPFQPWDPYLEEFGQDLLAQVPEGNWALLRHLGSQVALPTDGLSKGQGFLVREDILQANGRAMPRSAEELESLFAFLKEEYPDSIPFAAPNHSTPGAIILLAGWPEGGAGGHFLLDENGDMTMSWLTPEFREYVEIYRRWVQNDWVSRDSTMMLQETATNLLVTGRSFVTYASIGDLNTLNREIQRTFPTARFVLIPPVRTFGGGPAVADFISPTEVTYTASRNANDEALEAFMQYYNWQAATPENYHLSRYGIAGTHFQVTNDRLNVLAPFAGTNYYDGLYAFYRAERDLAYELPPSDATDSYLAAFETLQNARPQPFDYLAFTPDLTDWGAQMAYHFWIGGKAGDLAFNIIAGTATMADLDALEEEFYDNDGRAFVDFLDDSYRAWLATQ